MGAHEIFCLEFSPVPYIIGGMGCFRASLLVAFISTVSASRASFDLVLVADNNGSTTGPVAGKIHRYDGDGGVYLGSFGTFYEQIRGIAVNAATNEAFVGSASRMRVYNYNTGILKRELTVTGNVKFYNGRAYRSSGSILYEFNPSTGATIDSFLTAETIDDYVVNSNGSFATYADSSKNLRGYSAAGSLMGTSFVSQLGTTGRMSFDVGTGNVLLMSNSTVFIGTVLRSTFTLNTSGTISSPTVSGTLSSFSNLMIDNTEAHSGVWHLGQLTNDSKALMRIGPATSLPNSVVLTPQVNTLGPVAAVLAPEPGVLFGLAAGLALLKRRRKSN